MLIVAAHHTEVIAAECLCMPSTWFFCIGGNSPLQHALRSQSCMRSQEFAALPGHHGLARLWQHLPL
jgi:hypothetical protein